MVYLKPKQLRRKDCARRFVLKLYRHEASRGLFATAELLFKLERTWNGVACWIEYAWYWTAASIIGLYKVVRKYKFHCKWEIYYKSFFSLFVLCEPLWAVLKNETGCVITEVHLQKSVKVYTDNVPAAKMWRDVGKALRLSPEDLQEIGGPSPETAKAKSKHVDHRQVREESRKMLEKWMETSGENASVEHLLNVVKKLGLNDVAGKYCHVLQSE